MPELSMELKEFTTFSYALERISPFSLSISSSGCITLVGNRVTRILQPKFTFHVRHKLFQLDEYKLECPQSLPTADVTVQETHIYQSANYTNRNRLVSDLQLATQFADTTLVSRVVAWSPDGQLLAYLSNFGALKIIRATKDWPVVYDIDGLWLGEMKQRKARLNTFDEWSENARNVLIKGVTFHPKDSKKVLVVTKAGRFICVSLQPELKVIAETETTEAVSCMKWYEGFLVVGSVKGTIGLYDISEDGKLGERTEIYAETDGYDILSIDILENQIVAVKGSFVMVFWIKEKHVKESVTMIQGQITGIHRIKPSEYIVTTLKCGVKHIKIMPDFTVSVTQIKCQIPAGYCLYGVTSSANGAYIVLAGFATAEHDHLVLREPAVLFFYHWKDINPMVTLVQNPQKSLSNLMDFVQVVRYLGGKDMSQLKAFEAQLNLNPKNKDFVYHLKLSLLLMYTRFTFFSAKSDCNLTTTKESIRNLNTLIDVFTSVKMLNDPKASNVVRQRHKNNIQDYLRVKPALTVYMDIHKALNDFLLDLVLEANLYEVEPESCEYCDKVIANYSLKCEDGHEPPRCSITLEQNVNLKTLVCQQCMRVAVLGCLGQECPLCDVDFEIS